MKEKISSLLQRLVEVELFLGSPDALKDPKKYKDSTREHAYLSEVKDLWEEISRLRAQFFDNEELLKIEKDADFLDVLNEDNEAIQNRLAVLEGKLENLLVPPDPNDDRNVIMELRAGTGGDEAAIFVGDCVRMYKYFSEKNNWSFEELSCAPSERGGFKEYVMVLSGEKVYRFMKYEAGTHRVQRVPETEAQGRVHTSAITVAVLLEPDEEEDIDLEEKDLRVDTYRASGAGGQHVNVTDSAVRITHLPSSMVAYCSEEKSQHQNKLKALRLLKAKIIEEERMKKQKEEAETRAMQIGSGDRSERIRTYNFPQNRITDHRINLTRYNLDLVINGELDEIIESIIKYFHQKSKE